MDAKEILQLRQEILALRAEVNILKRDNKVTSAKKEKETIDVNSEQFWYRIRKSLDEGDVAWIKVLIKDKTISMFDTDPTFNRTLLVESAKWGYYAIVELCISFGADVDHKDRDGLTALDHAEQQGWFRSEQVLLFNRKNMNINLIHKIRDQEKIVRKQRGFVQNICNELPGIGDQQQSDIFTDEESSIFRQTALKLMITMIHKRLGFSDDFLCLCWRIASHKNNNDPLQSDLWAAINAAIADILSHGSKRDWFWLKTYVFPSQIWYARVNVDEEIKDDYDDDDDKQEEKQDVYDYNIDILPTKIDDKSYLYYKLLELVDNACKIGMSKLEKNLNRVIAQNTLQWDSLCKWEADERFLIVRNDTIANSLKSKYTYNQLSKHSEGQFSATRFYDMNGFLTEMILLAQEVDNEFQESVQNIFDINKATNKGELTRAHVTPSGGGDDEKKEQPKINTSGIVIYRRGPVKSIERARKKAIKLYFDRKFPTTACILDFNRCELIFGDIGAMLMGVNILKTKIENGRAGCIKRILRDKNGFRKFQTNQDSQKDTDNTSMYADIKINVLIKGKNHNICGEIVFLLAHMLQFKDELNKYYQIQKQQPYIRNVVTPILPILLDENRNMMAAANSGNINGFLELMVLNNKNEKDLIKPVRNKTIEGIRKRNILHSICKNGHYKAYVFLKNILQNERFIVNLFARNEKNRNSIEYAVSRRHHKIIDDIFRNKGVLKRYQENDDDLFSLVLWTFAWNNDESVTNKVFRKLKITDKDIIKFVDHYKYPEPVLDEYIKGKLSKKYHKMKLLHQVAISNTSTLPRLKQLVEKIGQEMFIKNVFALNGWDQNVIESVLIESDSKDKQYTLDILNYIFSVQQIIDRCNKDDDILYRIALALKPKYDYQITQFIFSKLPALNDEQKLKQLNVDDDIIAVILQ